MCLSLLKGVPDCSSSVVQNSVKEWVQVFHHTSIDCVLLRAAIVWEQNNSEIAKEQVVRHAIVPKCGSHSVPEYGRRAVLMLILSPAGGNVC